MDLAVKTREIVSKPRALRKQGLIPAELYGRGTKNEHITVEAKVFNKALKEAGESTVLNLIIEGTPSTKVGTSGKRVPALIYDIQRDSTQGNIVHIDFYQVRMDEKIKAKVAIEFTGESPAVKEKDGIVNTSMKEIEVEALPGDLPHHLTVDLSVLKELNQSIHAKDIVLPKGVRITVDPEATIATVTEKMKEEEIIAPVEPVDVTAVKVESEEKAAERAKEKEATTGTEK